MAVASLRQYAIQRPYAIHYEELGEQLSQRSQTKRESTCKPQPVGVHVGHSVTRRQLFLRNAFDYQH